jgi:hypothetical protein
MSRFYHHHIETITAVITAGAADDDGNFKLVCRQTNAAQTIFMRYMA